MKETVKVNLGGRLFNLDIDAYERLKKYLDSLQKKFGQAPNEADEIIEDIEARIAELLTVKISEKKEVITLEDVEQIIAKLGTAEEMADDDSEQGQNDDTKETKTDHSQKTKKRFYRDVDHSVLGGVGSGLGAYFNIDPIWIRLIFVGLFFANLAGLLIYIILWVVIPPAITTAQKLEMQGKPVNISNIGESVKGEFDKVKNSFTNMSSAGGIRKIENVLSELVKTLGNIILMFIKVIGSILGVSLIVVLVVVIISFIAGGAIIFPHHWFHGWQFPHMQTFSHLSLTGICLLLVIGIPIFALLIKIVKLLFGITARNSVAIGIGATIWVLALISLIVILVVDVDNGTYRDSYHSDYTYKVKSNKLYIDVDMEDNHRLAYYQFFNLEFVWDEWSDDYLEHPEVKVKRWDNDYIQVDTYKSFYNINIGKRIDRNDNIVDYKWTLSDSKLVLNEFFSVDEDYIWQWPKLEWVITLPRNIEVEWSNEAREIFRYKNKKHFIEYDNDEEKFNRKQATEDKVEMLKELEDSI